jgi:hypothetical protein
MARRKSWAFPKEKDHEAESALHGGPLRQVGFETGISSWRIHMRHLILAVLIILVGLNLRANAASPCCTVTGVNAKTGSVTAQETATGRTFQFQVTNAALLKTLHTGSPVFANFSAKQVSLNGSSVCCAIVSLSAAGSQPQRVPVAGVTSAPSVAGAASATPQPVSAMSAGFQCDSSGVCYCTGGKNSADCQNLGNSPLCGTKIGCDGIGRCYCAPPVTKW